MLSVFRFSRKLHIDRIIDGDGSAIPDYYILDRVEEALPDTFLHSDMIGVCSDQHPVFGGGQDPNPAEQFIPCFVETVPVRDLCPFRGLFF